MRCALGSRRAYRSMIVKKPIKPKACKACKNSFSPWSTTQIACSIGCALTLESIRQEKVVRKAATEHRKQTRAEKEASKTLRDHLAETQVLFNRLRRLQCHGMGCISCGTKNPRIQYAAGHLYTVKARPDLRFTPDNVWLQCNFNCNSQKSGNVLAYREALINLIGQERVDALTREFPVKWNVEELKQMQSEFKAEIKQLQRKLA